MAISDYNAIYRYTPKNQGGVLYENDVRLLQQRHGNSTPISKGYGHVELFDLQCIYDPFTKGKSRSRRTY